MVLKMWFKTYFVQLRTILLFKFPWTISEGSGSRKPKNQKGILMNQNHILEPYLVLYFIFGTCLVLWEFWRFFWKENFRTINGSFIFKVFRGEVSLTESGLSFILWSLDGRSFILAKEHDCHGIKPFDYT